MMAAFNERAEKKIVPRKTARRRRSRKGQTLVEYALILAFISVVAISVLLRLGAQVRGIFTTMTSQLASANSTH
jgi:Flp pilus assembly pilin Flp